MDNKIRKVLKNDLSEILRLNQDLADLHAIIDDYFLPGKETVEVTENQLESVIQDEKSLVLVVEKDTGLGGYFIGRIEGTKPFIRPDPEGRISGAYLKPQLRGKGYARRAMKKLTKWFKSNNVHSIRLSVHSDNQNAIQAWQSLGFEEYMKRMKKKI